MDFIEAIEESLGKKAEKELLPHAARRTVATCADVQDLVADLKYKPDSKGCRRHKISLSENYREDYKK